MLGGLLVLTFIYSNPGFYSFASLKELFILEKSIGPTTFGLIIGLNGSGDSSEIALSFTDSIDWFSLLNVF